jgi:hypothetical protein
VSSASCQTLVGSASSCVTLTEHVASDMPYREMPVPTDFGPQMHVSHPVYLHGFHEFNNWYSEVWFLPSPALPNRARRRTHYPYHPHSRSTTHPLLAQVPSALPQPFQQCPTSTHPPKASA